MALGHSPIVSPTARRIKRLTFQSAVTSEISDSLSAFERASVESVWQTPNTRHQPKKPGLSSGQPLTTQAMNANGRRNVKRPQTLMYSSSAWPRRFIVVLRSTWNSAAARARTSHMATILSRAQSNRALRPGRARRATPVTMIGEGLDGQRDLDGIGASVRDERLADAVEVEAVRDQGLRPDRAAGDQPQRLGELVLVDHRARDRDLAPHHREERHRRRLVGQPREHDPSPRSHQLERVRHGVGGPGGLDDEIDTFATRKPAADVPEGAVAGRVRGLGAQVAGEGEAPPRAAHDEHACAPSAKDLEGQEPERTRPHDRRGLAALRGASFHGAYDDGQGLGEQ